MNRKITFTFFPLFLLCIVILSFSGACSLFEDKTYGEAKQKTQAWWDSTFSKCGNDYYTQYDGNGLIIDSFNPIKKVLIQFKNLSYKLDEKKLSEKDRLNGEEWRGSIIIPTDTPFRYYDMNSSDGNKKWSSWISGGMLYEEDSLDKNLEVLDKSTGVTPLTNSTHIINFSKYKGKWSEPVSRGFKKLDCSVIPK